MDGDHVKESATSLAPADHEAMNELKFLRPMRLLNINDVADLDQLAGPVVQRFLVAEFGAIFSG